MNVQADYKQLVGEVKERNRFHKALLEIREIASKSSSLQELGDLKEKLSEVSATCESALEGVI